MVTNAVKDKREGKWKKKKNSKEWIENEEWNKVKLFVKISGILWKESKRCKKSFLSTKRRRRLRCNVVSSVAIVHLREKNKSNVTEANFRAVFEIVESLSSEIVAQRNEWMDF